MKFLTLDRRRQYGYKDVPSRVLGPVSDVLSIPIGDVFESTARQLHLADVAFGSLEDAYRDALTARHEPEWHLCMKRLEQHFRERGTAIEVIVVPTHDVSDRYEKLRLVGLANASVVARALHFGSVQLVACGLGTHVKATAAVMPTAQSAHRELSWLPAMGTYPGLKNFDAVALCREFTRCLGGTCLDLTTPGYARPNEGDDVFQENASHRRLFGGDRANPTGKMWFADTGLFGIGIAAPRNPMWDAPGRLRNPSLLRRGDYPAVGDLNGHYLCVRRDCGEVVVPSENREMADTRNPEAWDANRRASGAKLSMCRTIAMCHRMGQSRGGGMIVSARSKGHAATMYAVIEASLVNTCVLEYDCARALLDILQDPSVITKSLPFDAGYWS